ncbi:YjfB family protein [Gracilibacillus xinjiangensis]|uniref:YjfB family protein n=1 Tax=Gracilibacillus xinjiangensis TaxID=1193282 RepID=A0ABV8X226_9BACI
MDIAAMSVIMSQAQVKQQASISLLDKAMNTSEQQSNQMIKMLEQAIQPHLGSTVDVKA